MVTYKTLSTTSQSFDAAGTSHGLAAAPEVGYLPPLMRSTHGSVKPALSSRSMLRPVLVQRSLVSPPRMTARPWELAAM